MTCVTSAECNACEKEVEALQDRNAVLEKVRECGVLCASGNPDNFDERWKSFLEALKESEATNA